MRKKANPPLSPLQVYMYCKLGWVDIGIGTKVPLRFVTYEYLSK
jgi:hypothetical protein